jgi:hypothetical protein
MAGGATTDGSAQQTVVPSRVDDSTPTAASAGVPGFDTRDYPGDAVMASWRAQSPYRWVGYYLVAPCQTGTSWQGKREALRRMGWGVAVLFIGEQAWAPGAAPPPDSVPARCTRANVTGERGAADGRAAAAAARAEGFPRRTVVYLDVERTDSVPDAQLEYARAWARALRTAGYTPGLYAHARNVGPLLAAMRGDGRRGDVPLWVAAETGFTPGTHPSASGFAEADVWQGAFDRTESWGGTALRVDVDVATSPSPSAPPR